MKSIFRGLPSFVIGVVFLLLASAGFAQQAPPAEGTEADLIAVLESGSASLFDKAKACQQLAVVGTEQSVPVLTGLLSDPELSHYARFGLEPIPSPQVDVALREALEQLQGRMLVGVINSIGMRRDAAAVDSLQQLTKSDDPQVAACSAGSLARIGTDSAVAALQELLTASEPMRSTAAESLLTVAQARMAQQKPEAAAAICEALQQAELPQHLAMAALSGLIRTRGEQGIPLLQECLKSEDPDRFQVALQAAHELGNQQAAEMLIKELQPTLTGSSAENEEHTVRQVLMIYTLGDLKQEVALPVILDAAESSKPAVQLAAIRVLAELGDASAVPNLLTAALRESGELAEAARNSLAELPGEGVDAALTQRLGQSEGTELPVVIQLVGRRGIDSAVSELLRLADRQDPQVRQAAIEALGLTIDLERISALIDRLATPAQAEDAEAVKESLKRAVLRMPDRAATTQKLLDAMKDASSSARVDLLDLLGVVGGPEALAGVVEMAKSGGTEMEDAATRVLGEWMSADAAPVLLELTGQLDNERFRTRALRGYIRIARQLNVPTDQRIAMCRTALEVAQQDAEKKLALEVLARNPASESLALVVPYLDVESLRSEAATAAVTIAEKGRQIPGPEIAAAMQKVIDVSSDDEITKRARTQLRRARRN